MIINLSPFPVLKPILNIVAQQNKRVFLVGGFVRDILLNRPSKDIDIVVEGSGIEFAEKCGTVMKKKVAVFKNFGTAMLRSEGWEIEFVGARKESYRQESRKPTVEEGTLEEDQLRRDFTINALAISLNPEDVGRLVDPFNGMTDLQNKILKTPLEPVQTFSDDPLRMMRAVRFATQLGFTIDNKVENAIRETSHRILGGVVSMERICEELQKIIMTNVPSQGFYLLDRLKLLHRIMPCLEALKNVESIDNRQHKDNFHHSLKVLDNVADKSMNIWLRWAALLHDVGKPATKRFDPKAGWTFHTHEFVGSKMIPKIFGSLKLPLNESMKYVQKLVLLHLRPIVLSQDIVTDSAVRRLLFDAGNDIDDLMLLCRADITSKNEIKVNQYLRNFDIVEEKLRQIEEKDRIRNFQPPISGELIMQHYGLPPCKSVGLIKEVIKEAILEGEIENNYEQAFSFMEKYVAQHRDKLLLPLTKIL